LRNYTFGETLRLLGPADPVPYLDRAFGSWLWGSCPSSYPQAWAACSLDGHGENTSLRTSTTCSAEVVSHPKAGWAGFTWTWLLLYEDFHRRCLENLLQARVRAWPAPAAGGASGAPPAPGDGPDRRIVASSAPIAGGLPRLPGDAPSPGDCHRVCVSHWAVRRQQNKVTACLQCTLVSRLQPLLSPPHSHFLPQGVVLADLQSPVDCK